MDQFSATIGLKATGHLNTVNWTRSGVTMGPADPALQGAPFQRGAKMLENMGHYSENLTVVLAKVCV